MKIESLKFETHQHKTSVNNQDGKNVCTIMQNPKVLPAGKDNIYQEPFAYFNGVCLTATLLRELADNVDQFNL